MLADALTRLVGQTVDGKYRIDERLGQGGMGAVFRATHVGTDRVVAVKVIHPALADQPEYLERFRREARACGRLRHPNIVDVTDFGVGQTREGRLAYLVMEYLDGCTLADVLRDEPTPPLQWVIDILEQVCEAVESAHRQGILHRDLKPENIWLEPNRRGGYSAKVLDFGLAKLEPAGTSPAPTGGSPDPALSLASGAEEMQTLMTPAVTMASSQVVSGSALVTRLAGTPGYMAPEQAKGDPVTPRTDVYSLGVIAYRMLAGREPFTGSITEVIDAHKHATPASLQSLRKDLPLDATNLVMSALSKDPQARPASAGAFGNMLAGQLEPTGAFFRRAAAIYFGRFRLVLTLGTLSLIPAILWSLLLAGWAAAYAAGVGVPSPGGMLGIVPATMFALLVMVAGIGSGGISIAVLHAMAAPMKPIDVAALRRAYEPRIRNWAVSLVPFLKPRLGAMLLMYVGIGVMPLFRSWIRSFERPGRVLVALGVLSALLAPSILWFWWITRREKMGLRQGMFVAPAMLVEGLDADAARQRSVLLTSTSGNLQQRVRTRAFAAIMIASILLGMLLGGARLSAAQLASLAPLAVVVIALLMSFTGVVTSMMYFNARRATGESLDRILEDFDRAVLPPEHWQRAHRERVAEHLGRTTTFGPRAKAASPEAQTEL